MLDDLQGSRHAGERGTGPFESEISSSGSPDCWTSPSSRSSSSNSVLELLDVRQASRFGSSELLDAPPHTRKSIFGCWTTPRELLESSSITLLDGRHHPKIAWRIVSPLKGPRLRPGDRPDRPELDHQGDHPGSCRTVPRAGWARPPLSRLPTTLIQLLDARPQEPRDSRAAPSSLFGKGVRNGLWGLLPAAPTPCCPYSLGLLPAAPPCSSSLLGTRTTLELRQKAPSRGPNYPSNPPSNSLSRGVPHFEGGFDDLSSREGPLQKTSCRTFPSQGAELSRRTKA